MVKYLVETLDTFIREEAFIEAYSNNQFDIIVYLVQRKPELIKRESNNSSIISIVEHAMKYNNDTRILKFLLNLGYTVPIRDSYEYNVNILYRIIQDYASPLCQNCDINILF